MTRFISTGITELNDLLTSNGRQGIALPEPGSGISSTLVLKGQPGAGKSVISSILAFNLHKALTTPLDLCEDGALRPHGQSDGEIGVGLKVAKQSIARLLPVYFSFAQPAQGVRRYIDDILQPGDGQCYPLIVSPRRMEYLASADGLSVLRKCLIDQLTPLMTLSVDVSDGVASNRLTWALLKKFVEGFRDSPYWDTSIKEYGELAGPTDEIPITEHLTPIVFVDPINSFFDHRDSRATISKLFETFRILTWPLILTMEDAGPSASEFRRELASHVEFEADVVVSLEVTSSPYFRRRMTVTKSRVSKNRQGVQLYRIEQKDHALSNLESPWKKNHPGLLIFRSGHWVIFNAMQASRSTNQVGSGIHAFDCILCDGVREKPEAALESDALILVGGKKGAHKLTVAFNLLVGGLWVGSSTGSENKSTERGAGVAMPPALPPGGAHARQKPPAVLLLSLGEESGINVPEIALAYSEEPQAHSNGDEIAWKKRLTPTREGQAGKKAIITEWSNTKETKPGQEGVLVEVTLRPGYLAPEEFLWIVEQLIENYKPSRILLDNTAHLRMRFPDLARDEMLFTALSDIVRSTPCILIVIDVAGIGSDEELTYGLEESADYLVDLAPADRGHEKRRIVEKLNLVGNSTGIDCAVLTLRNVRGKNYKRVPRGVTVVRGTRGGTLSRNELRIVDYSDFDVLSETNNAALAEGSEV